MLTQAGAVFSAHLSLHQSLILLDQVRSNPKSPDLEKARLEQVDKALEDYTFTCRESGKLVLDLSGLKNQDFELVLEALEDISLYLTEIDISFMASKDPIALDPLYDFIFAIGDGLEHLNCLSLTAFPSNPENENVFIAMLNLIYEVCSEFCVLKLSGLKINEELAKSICLGIDDPDSQLLSLDLEGCDFTNSSFSIVCKSIQQSSQLNQLNLSLCSFNLHDEKTISDLISSNKSLHRIDFYHTAFSNDSSIMNRGPCFLLKALLQNSTLEQIYLPHINVTGWNELSGNKSIREISYCNENPYFRSIMHENEKRLPIRNTIAKQALMVSRFLSLFEIPFELKEMIVLKSLRDSMPLDEMVVTSALLDEDKVGKFACRACMCPFSALRLVKISYFS